MTRKPATPCTRPAGRSPRRDLRRAHAAGADRMERAGDIVAGYARRARRHPAASCARSTRRSASVAKIGPAAAAPVDQRGDRRALDLVAGRDAVEPPQAVGEFHRKRQPRHRAHRVMRQNIDAAAEAMHEALQVEVVAGEIELDQRIVAGSAEISDTRPRAIGLSSDGARLATWCRAGSTTSCTGH